MHDYREIRVRLNLTQQRDRWLASALTEAAEALGAPIASIVRRALAIYLRDRVETRTTVKSPPTTGALTKHPNREAHEGGTASGRETKEPSSSAVTKDWDAALHDQSDSARLMNRLASLGTPPEGAMGGQ